MAVTYQSTNSDIFFSKNGNKEKDHIIVQSVIHTSQMPENSLWPKFMTALNTWFKVPEVKLKKINDIIRVCQVTRNVLEDAAENSLKRKGAATANSVFGSADAINGGYYSCFIILEKLRDLDNFDAVVAGSKYFKEWSKGQGLEIYWRDNIICPSENEYLKMAVSKTGSLIELTFKLMQLFGDNKSNFDELIKILSKFFHLYDDYVSLKSMDKYLLNKNGCDTVSEGKFSFPVVHAMWSHPDDVQLINLLRQKSTDEDVINYFLKLTEKFGGFEYTRNTLQKLKIQAEEEMNKVGENPEMAQVLEYISSKLTLA